MKLEDRQKELISRIVRDYIELAQPISSEYLKERHRLDISPATIRLEMQDLAEQGFLEQPHTSAGRVPTDKAYRFFVDELMSIETEGREGDFGLDFSPDFESGFEDIFRLTQRLTRELARNSASLVLTYMAEEDVLLKDGWEQVLKNPEFAEKDLVYDFIDFLGYLETNARTLKPRADMEIHIGQENPCPKAGGFSLITFKYGPKDFDEIVFSLVGPKRMAYDRNINLVNSVMKLFE